MMTIFWLLLFDAAHKAGEVRAAVEALKKKLFKI